MAEAVVESVAHGWVEASGNSIASAAQAHTAGRTLVVFVRHEGAATSLSIADTAGNTYTPGTYRSHANGDLNGQMFYVENCLGNASNVVTVTLGAARTWRGISVYEISGLLASGAFVDEDWGQASAATSAVAGSTNVENGIIVVGPTMYGTATTWGIAAGYTLNKNSTSSNATQTTGIGYKTITATGTEAPDVNTNVSNDPMILTMSFEAPVDPPVTPIRITQSGLRF